MTQWRREEAFEAAEGAFHAGDWKAALGLYNDWLVRRLADLPPGPTASRMTVLDLVVVDRLATLALLFGQADASDALLEGLQAVCEQAGNEVGADHARLERIHLSLGRGHLREAYTRLRGLEERVGPLAAIPFRSPSALADWEDRCSWQTADSADQPALFARFYLVTGRLLASLGRYGDARGALARGCYHSEPGRPALARQAWVPLSLALAGVELETGDLAAVDRALTRLAHEIDGQLHPGWYARHREVAGKLALLRGELGVAALHFAEVVQVCHRGGFRKPALEATLNLAQLLVFLNRTHDALELLASASVEASSLGDMSALARLDWLRSLAVARGESLVEEVAVGPPVVALWRGPGTPVPPGDREGVADPLDLPQAGAYLAFFEDRTLGFYWLLGRRGIDPATAWLERMRRTFATTDSRLIQLRLRLLDAVLTYYQQDYASAASRFANACTELEELTLLPELWQARRFLGWCWKRLGRPAEEVESLARQTQSLLDTLTASLPAENRAVYLLNKWTAEEEYLAAEAEALAREKQALPGRVWYVRPWRRLRLWHRLHGFLNGLGRHRQQLLRGAFDGLPAEQQPGAERSLWHRLVAAPRGRVTLSFLVLPDRVVVVRSGRMMLDFGVSDLTRLEVRNLVRRWHELMSGRAGALARVAEARQLADELSRRLQLPELLAGIPPATRAITLVLDDALHGFPCAALQLDGQPLVARWALSIGFWAAATQQVGHVGEGALLVGVAEGGIGIAPLPGALPEVQAMATWWAGSGRAGRAEVLTGTQVNKEAVLACWSRVGLMHLACHGIFVPESPDRSGLLLRPGEVNLKRLGREDMPGMLSLREVSRLRPPGPSHVTLSSCYGADNFVLPGRWVIGLPETLCGAGAGSVLGSLWPVDDRVAMPFMSRFYHYLADLPRDEALRRCQLDCLHGRLQFPNGVEGSDPLHWAGFVLSGNPDSLSVTANRRNNR